MKKIKDIVIYEDDGYNAFPSIARGGDGVYYLAFRHAPDRRLQYGATTHMDQESAVYMVRSADGLAWSGPRVILNREMCDETGPCVHALADGSLLLTYFGWSIEPAHKRAMLEKVLRPCVLGEHYPEDRIARLDGTNAMRTRDGGETFEGPFLIEKNCALQGKIAQLPNGTMLAPLTSYGSEMGSDGKAVLYASADGGRQWAPYAFICGPLSGCSPEEAGLFRTKGGRLYCFIRTVHNICYCASSDDGQTWSAPVDSGIPANVPFNALQLPDGRVFLSYGRRAEPYGIRALMLDTELADISPGQELVLRDDGSSGDLAYNWAELLPGGDILVAYYFHSDKLFGGRRHIAGTIVRP